MNKACGRPSFVWLGTGAAVDTQLLDQFLEQHDNGAAVLLDARASVVEELQQRYADQTNCKVSHSVIGQQTGRSSFYTLNLPEFSSLQRPTGLIALFPGATVQKAEPVETVGVDKYIAGLGIDKNQPNELYIDIPAQTGTIIRQLIEHKQLHCFTQLHLSVSLESLYEDAEKLVDIEGFLSKQGYEVITTDNADPDIPIVSFKLNPLWQSLDGVQQQLNEALEGNVKLVDLHRTEKQEVLAKIDELNACLADKNKEEADQSKQVARLQQELDSKAEQIAKQAQIIEVEQSAKAELQQRLEQSENCKAKTEVSFVELRKQIAGLQQQLDSKTNQIAEKIQKAETEQSTKAELQAILENTKDVNSKLEDQVAIGSLEALLEEKLKQMVAVQSQEINKTIGNLKNHVTASLGNTAKQLECFYGIQSYIERGVKPLSFHGWPISPDIALFLVQKTMENKYDAIIEFGSGTSTILFAKTIRKIAAEDVTKRIITFEHNKEYFEKTKAELQAHDLDGIVDLVYAPLIEYTYKDSSWLYYSCSEKLSELKLMSNQGARFLVLVDGPPGSTGPLARFPCLPHLLSVFPDSSIDLVLDDYDRQEEKEISKQWEVLLKDRSIKFKSESIPSEKGLYFCTIN